MAGSTSCLVRGNPGSGACQPEVGPARTGAPSPGRAAASPAKGRRPDLRFPGSALSDVERAGRGFRRLADPGHRGSLRQSACPGNLEMRKLAPLILIVLALAASWNPGRAFPTTEWGVSVLEVGRSRDAVQEQEALRDSLELMGIPSRATSSVNAASLRPLMLIGGLLLNTELSPPDREALYSYVERGGILLATQVQGNRFFPLFGLSRAGTSRLNFEVRFTSMDDPSMRYLNRPEEKVISLGDPKLYSETVWSTEYLPSPGADVLARYDNGAAAVTRHAYGRGLAYALGLGCKETTLIPQLAQSYEAARRFIIWFEPSGDGFRLLLRGLYEDTVHPF